MTERKGTYPNIRVSQEGYIPDGSNEVVLTPHAQVKGNVTRDTEFKEPEEGKKAFISFSMGINFPAMKLWDMAKRNGTKGKTYDEKAVFIQVVAYEKMAERLTKIHKDFKGVLKGDQLDVSGKLSLEKFTKTNGDKGEMVRLTLDRFEVKYNKTASTDQSSQPNNHDAEEPSQEDVEAALAQMQDDDDDDIPF